MNIVATKSDLASQGLSSIHKFLHNVCPQAFRDGNVSTDDKTRVFAYMLDIPIFYSFPRNSWPMDGT